jgi:hypothetical protein
VKIPLIQQKLQNLQQAHVEFQMSLLHPPQRANPQKEALRLQYPENKVSLEEHTYPIAGK